MNQLLKYTIYQIKHKQQPHCYIGCTTNLYNRLAVHKTYANQGKERNLYNTINQNGGWDEYDVIVLEQFECISRTDGEARENYWINKLEQDMMVINTYKKCMHGLPPGKTNVYYYKNREHKKLLSKLNYYQNRESILERLREKYASGATHPGRAEGEL